MTIPTKEEIHAYVASRQAAMEKAGMLALLLEYHGIRRFHEQ